MKIRHFYAAAAVAAALALAGCRATKELGSNAATEQRKGFDREAMVRKLTAQKPAADYLTSKIRCRLMADGRDLTLTGSLKMKRGEMIRLQLVAFGLVEAARLELTADHVLVMDRIGKRYGRLTYSEISRLAGRKITFENAQALFWGETTLPGRERLTEADYRRFDIYEAGTDAALATVADGISYRWMADRNTARIKSVTVAGTGVRPDGLKVTWTYGDTQPYGNGTVNRSNSINIVKGDKRATLILTLEEPKSESGWETPTVPSAKYRQIGIDDLKNLKPEF